MANMIQTMKRFLYSLCLLWLFATTASAYDFTKDSIYYNILSDSELTCEVTSGSNDYSGSIVIPATVEYNGNTYSVTSIGDKAFYNCYRLTSINIPNSVTSIGMGAFRWCGGLTSINIPNSVTNIGDQAFYGCDKLTSIDIPNSVTSIGSKAFYDCTGLHSITIGTGVLSIGTDAYYYNAIEKVIWLPNTPPQGYEEIYGTYNYASNDSYSNLQNVTVYPYLSSLFEVDGIKYVPISPSEQTCAAIDCAYNGTKDIRLGKTVHYQGSELSLIDIGPALCYDNDSIEVLHIESYAGSISSSAFSYCNNLETATLKDVTGIGDEAFYGCDGLTTIDIPNSVTSIGDEAFYGCDGLTTIDIPNSVTSIGSSTFYDCDALTSVNIGNSVTNIGEQAFYNCTGLHSVTIGTGVLSIGTDAFSDNYYGNIDNIDIKKVIWLPNTPPEGTKEIDGAYNYVSNDAYSGLSNETVYPYLSSLFEVDGIKYVPISPSERTCAAIDCAYDGTKEIRIGKTVNYQGIELNLLDIRPALCYDNDSIETLHIEGYAGNIGDYAFYDCEKLSGIALPNTVASLGASCFEGCAALGYAEIGSGIGELPDACFSGCAALTDIEIPATVERIADDVFQGCTSLAYVTLCDRETELALGSNDDEPLFADCPLNTVYIGGDITYPTSSSKGYSPFYRNTSLETVQITDKETEISENEFYGCTNLKNVTLGNGIEQIGNYAFSGCASLDNFTFGTNLKSIGEEAFSDCTAMTSLTSHTVVPPVCGTQALDDINKWNCKLFVPDEAIPNYQQADQWKEFFFLESVGMDEHWADTAADELSRILEGPVQVYSLSGTLLRQMEKAASVSEALSGLERGVYILQGNGLSRKVTL